MTNILKNGTIVRTTTDSGATDWDAEGREHVQWGAEGMIIDHSDAHGLCYEVEHDDAVAWYDPSEFVVIGRGHGTTQPPDKPSIKLRDGWEWTPPSPGYGWSANIILVDDDGDHSQFVMWRCRPQELPGISVTDGHDPTIVPPDVILAVILANAPEAFMQTAAAISKPVPDGKCPRHYGRWGQVTDNGKHLSWMWAAFGTPNEEDVAEGDEEPRTLEEATTDILEHRNAVAADCFPEMAATIERLKDELDSLGEFARVEIAHVVAQRDAQATRIATLEAALESIGMRASVQSSGFARDVCLEIDDALGREVRMFSEVGENHR